MSLLLLLKSICKLEVNRIAIFITSLEYQSVILEFLLIGLSLHLGSICQGENLSLSRI
jgi:hypothetical protein